MNLRDEAEEAATYRPLLDDGWGPGRAARYERRRRSYVTAGRLQLRPRGRASVRLDLPYAAGRGPLRAEAAALFAIRFGVEARPVGRSGAALRITGRAENVARYVDGVGRALDHAEQLASWAARMYGACSRRPQHTTRFEALGAAGQRAAAAYFRALAFRRIAQVLTAPQPATVPELDPALPLWEQAQTLGAVLGEYGWLDISRAYDPAAALDLLAAAEQVQAPAATRWPVANSHGEQLALFGAESDAPPQLVGPVVVIPCSGTKLTEAAEAGRLYTGSLHVHARRTADALTAHGGTILVLSAAHGFLPLDQVIEPYDHTWDDAGSVTVEELRDQAAELGLTGADVILLTPGRYTGRALAVWPHARTPLAHLGIGRQRGRLTALREHPDQYATAA
ncbi:DUF6884 domain-containing protein [Streptomyces niveus]|uniref:DUF6884 domain-containing protein n=1 Tax=Streptomyces niveus TaxID=193462 RepID=UPI003715A6E0